MTVELQKEHKWLEQLVGEWTYVSEAGAPGEAPSRSTGTESVRSLGGAWVVGEARGEMPDGGTGTSLMTLGYDPEKKRYVGTFIGSMMTALWVYEGELDEAERKLTLNTEGPSVTGEGTAMYRDAIEITGADERVMTSSFQDGAGNWNHFMTMSYRRVK